MTLTLPTPSLATATQLLTSWQFLVGVLVLTTGPTLALRRWRQAQRALAPAERAEAADRRGRRLEDHATLVIAAAAATLSANGLRRVGHNVMGLSTPADLLPFVALDIAAMVCGRRARRRATHGESGGLSGILFWVLAAISSFFSASEAGSLLGATVRAVWPILAAVLWEIGSLDERRAAAAHRGRPDRRLALVRLLHPAESLSVAMIMAAKQDISQEDATREARISAAAERLYKLGQAQDAAASAGRFSAGWFRFRQRAADRRTQHAFERAGCTEPTNLTAVAARKQMRTHVSRLAGMTFDSPAEFNRRILDKLLTEDALIPTAGRRRTTRTRHYPRRHPGASQQVRASSVDAGMTKRPARDPNEVKLWLVEHAPWDDNGGLTWAINKIAAETGIGNRAATELKNTARQWGAELRTGIPAPEPTADPESEALHAELATAPAPEDDFQDALELANSGRQPVSRPSATSQLLLSGGQLALTPHHFDALDSGLLIPAGAGRRD
ncbi:DUF2637 domain-containing protein [Streptacidiphilus jiangxiensis]|nr:DUF2637 domain-containing protein [Streptacidiphilus jiangxiensis]